MTSLTIQESDIGRLDGKVAIITGGASGIGLATARIFSSRGADVHVLDINPIDADVDSFALKPTDATTAATASATATTTATTGSTVTASNNNNEGTQKSQKPTTATGISDGDSTPPPSKASSFPAAKSTTTTISRSSGRIIHHHCDVTHWPTLLAIFTAIGPVDIAVANAGVSQESDPFTDSYDASGTTLQEPAHAVLNVNYRAVLNFVKLSLRAFRSRKKEEVEGIAGEGSLVIVSSATAYAPEQSLPVYSATKLALIGLIRSLRPSIHLHNATINGVAPAATVTKLLPMDLAAPIMAAGSPVSHAHHVGLAIAYSTVARQAGMVEGYGRDGAERVNRPGRWNGRVILTLGDRWTEVEGPLAERKDEWMGGWNVRMTRFQQGLTDQREPEEQVVKV